MITEHQKQSLLKTYVEWTNNQEIGFDLDNINHWLRDFTEFTNIFTKYVDIYLDFYTERTDNNFENFAKNIYNAVTNNKSFTSHTEFKDIINYGYWDVDFKSISVTIGTNPKFFEFNIPPYFNGYVKENGIELSEPFEDIEYTTLKYFAEEEMQKTQIQMLAKIEELINKPNYDDLSSYEQGIRDMINFINNKDYATTQGVYFHVLDTFVHNHSKEFRLW